MPGGSGISENGVSMQTVGVTREGLDPRTDAPVRHDNHLDSPGIHPDGRILPSSYDARRIAAVDDGLGSTTHVTLDAMGNRIKEELKDLSGALVRSQRRVYDALNRVQNRITPAQ